MAPDFFHHSDVTHIARNLLGKVLLTRINNHLTGGVIVETEAYSHTGDQATQRHLERRPNSAAAMLQPGGNAYIYRSHGHSMLNIVTNAEGIPDSVLIRAIEPVIGTDIMMQRRGLESTSPRLCAGPGMLTEALGITPELNGIAVTSRDAIWIEDNQNDIDGAQVITSPRVGIAYAGEDAALPWRFRVAESRWTSRAR